VVGDEEMAFLAHHARLHCLLELCDVVGVDEELQAMTVIADRLGQPFFRWHVASLRAVRAILDGRLAEAERLARGTLEIPGLRPNTHIAYMFDHALMVAIRWAQGRLGEFRESIGSHAERYPSVPRWRDALVAAELGDEPAARAELERHARSGFADLPHNVLWVLHLCALAEACVLVRDRRRAAQLYELLSPYAERHAISLSTMPMGPVALRLGMLAAMLERWDDAELHFATATEGCRRLGARAVTARVLYEQARMLLARGAGPDQARAGALLARAEGICRELDLPGIADRVAALTAQAPRPGRPVPPGNLPAPCSGAKVTTGRSPTGASWPGSGTPRASATSPACCAAQGRRSTCSSWWERWKVAPPSPHRACAGEAPSRPASPCRGWTRPTRCSTPGPGRPTGAACASSQTTSRRRVPGPTRSAPPPPRPRSTP
jgi:hypothetical protein